MDAKQALKICQTMTKLKGGENNLGDGQKLDNVQHNEKSEQGCTASLNDNKLSENNNCEEVGIVAENPSGEDEENYEKIKALLVVFEKKLHSSLISLIKMTTTSSKSSKKRWVKYQYIGRLIFMHLCKLYIVDTKPGLFIDIALKQCQTVTVCVGNVAKHFRTRTKLDFPNRCRWQQILCFSALFVRVSDGCTVTHCVCYSPFFVIVD